MEKVLIASVDNEDEKYLTIYSIFSLKFMRLGFDSGVPSYC